MKEQATNRPATRRPGSPEGGAPATGSTDERGGVHAAEPKPAPDATAERGIVANDGHPTAGRDAAAIAARIAVAIVFALNVQCALQFVIAPGSYAAAYELSGVAGEAAVRGLGVAFLMWNATYPAVVASPRRFRPLYIVVLAQQAIGLFGETAILLGLPAGHDVLAGGILRFIAFDTAGLALMAAAFAWLAVTRRRSE